jgi:DNA-binding MarR family transcriptional regulator
MTIHLSLWRKLMARQRTDTAYNVTWLVRRLFRAMAARADEYLVDAELSAADRAIMEFLYPRRALSVPGIARLYNVSRQHVQVTVNALIAKELLHSVVNPRHKRSRLIKLSDTGRDCFDEIRRHEVTVIEQVFDGISDNDLDTTQETLKTLLRKFE